ncbi:MAG: hypothetical protein NXI31_07960 [bacterium]|nr:hypothetical protein [bacterium]
MTVRLLSEGVALAGHVLIASGLFGIREEYLQGHSTDANGVVELRGLPTNRAFYSMSVGGPDGRTGVRRWRNEEFWEDCKDGEWELSLGVPTDLEVVVTGADGPLAGARVRGVRLDGAMASATTDLDGLARLNEMNGSASVSVVADGYRRARVSVEGDRVTITLQPAVEYRGVVVDEEGAAVPNARVWYDAPRDFDDLFGAILPLEPAVTGPAGRFVIRHGGADPDGVLRARKVGHCDASCAVTTWNGSMVLPREGIVGVRLRSIATHAR